VASLGFWVHIRESVRQYFRKFDPDEVSSMAQDRRLLVGAVPIAAVAGGLAATLFFSPVATRHVTAQDTASLNNVQLAAAMSLEGVFMRVSETVGPATVSITARPTSSPSSESEKEKQDEDETMEEFFRPAPRSNGSARGSGIIVRSDGYILTNDHIVEEADGNDVLVTLSDGTEYRGKAFRDNRSDLAIIKIEPEKPLPFVRLADSSKVKVGQWAIAIGSPFGQSNTMTAGIVSALHRKKTIRDGGAARLYTNLIQTDASINPGNSGGPLLNINGEVVGVNVAIFSPTGTSLGIGYAIPSNVAKRIVDQLIAQGKVTRGSLGVVPEDVPPALRKRLGTTTGAYLSEVAADTPAERAGLQPDDVVTAFNGQPVVDEGDLREAISATPPGTKINLTVLRSRKSQTIAATLVAAPEARAIPVRSSVPATPAIAKQRTAVDLGFEAKILSNAMRDASGIPPSLNGVLVSRVLTSSPAGEARLLPGSVITSLNALIQAAKPGEALTLIAHIYQGSEKPSKVAVNIIVP
jgi:S1-C subfamily serine protease